MSMFWKKKKEITKNIIQFCFFNVNLDVVIFEEYFDRCEIVSGRNYSMDRVFKI